MVLHENQKRNNNYKKLCTGIRQGKSLSLFSMLTMPIWVFFIVATILQQKDHRGEGRGRNRPKGVLYLHEVRVDKQTYQLVVHLCLHISLSWHSSLFGYFGYFRNFVVKCNRKVMMFVCYTNCCRSRVCHLTPMMFFCCLNYFRNLYDQSLLRQKKFVYYLNFQHYNVSDNQKHMTVVCFHSQQISEVQQILSVPVFCSALVPSPNFSCPRVSLIFLLRLK